MVIAGEWKARALIMAQLSEEGWQVRALRTIEEAILLLGRRLIEPRMRQRGNEGMRSTSERRRYLSCKYEVGFKDGDLAIPSEQF